MRSRAAAALLAWMALGLLQACAGCEGARSELDTVPIAAYPVTGDGELIYEGVLRAGPIMRDQDVVEHFELRSTEDHRLVRLQQEWSLGTADVEIVYDADWLPLRVWRRTTIPDATGPTGHLDVRIYDLVGAADGVLVARRTPTGAREGIHIRGARPTAVIAPGRGAVSAWLQRASLEVGERTRETVLDVREPLAIIREVTLRREDDREMDDLGRVRVYTIYGREPVFADDNDMVVGDMSGLRRADAVEGPMPDPMPDRGPFLSQGLPD